MTASRPSPRPSVWGPVLIAAVLLAIIGGSAGWVIGARSEAAEREAARDAARQSQQPVDDGTPADPGPTGDDGRQDDNGQEDEAGAIGPDNCPDHTVRLAEAAGADGALSRALYIRTARAQVWICTDERGRLFYQGHVYTRGERLVEGVNALFLTDVVADGDAYVATNSSGRRKTVYRVSRQWLEQTGDTPQRVESYAG